MSDQSMPLGTCVRTRGCGGACLHGGECDLGVIVIPMPWTRPPLSQNDRDERNRGGSRKIKEAKAEALAAILKAKVQPIVGAEVTLHYRIPDRIRRDADNLATTHKVCQDALVLAGVIPRDDWVCVPASGQRIHPPSDEGPALWLELRVLTRYDNEETA